TVCQERPIKYHPSCLRRRCSEDRRRRCLRHLSCNKVIVPAPGENPLHHKILSLQACRGCSRAVGHSEWRLPEWEVESVKFWAWFVLVRPGPLARTLGRVPCSCKRNRK